ncbi:glycosyltransferase [Chloroflexota bacterium]
MKNLVVFSSDQIKTSGGFTIQIDAMAVGCLIIATRNSAILKLVEHGVTGILSPPHNDELFAKNITTQC